MDKTKNPLYYFGHDKYNTLNLAIDEALFLNLDNKIIVRTYEFDKDCIILGRNDSVSNIVNFDENKNKIIITRRETGGMPIFVNGSVFAFSIVGPTSLFENNSVKLAIELHKLLGIAIANAIKNLDENKKVQIEVGNKYSIRLDGKPISGQSSKIENNKFLYHGVITIDRLNADKIKEFIVLNNSDYEKLSSLPALSDLFKNKSVRKNLKNLIPKEVSKLLRSDIIDLESKSIKEIKSKAYEIDKEKYQKREWVIGDKERGKTGRGYCLLYEG